MTAAAGAARPRVGLLVTCLVDLFRPETGFAAVKLLEDAGCSVEVPRAQTCCGQPAWNGGDRASAAAVARDVVAAFEGFDHVVAPSGSCAGMLRRHYPELLGDDTAWAPRARALAARSHELVSFLTDVRGVTAADIRAARAACAGVAAYHDSCAGLRELGVRAQPRALLAGVDGLRLRELPGAAECCGFGGTFCVKYPDISGRIVADKAADIISAGADMVLAGDLGCLMNIAGRLRREGAGVRVRHVAEVLAGMGDAPAIGEGREQR